MNQWTRWRWASFGIHGAIVSIPFVISAISAFLFWQRLFDSSLLAGVMVSVIDILALLGLVLHVVNIASPFQALRHLLPFVSIVPLGLEMHTLLQHNGATIAIVVSVLVTTILVVIAWQCFRTIEALFIDPVAVAVERVNTQLSVLRVSHAQLTATRAAAEEFVSEWQCHVSSASPDVSARGRTDIRRRATDRLGVDTVTVRALAEARGVSERTIWRQIRDGRLTAALSDIPQQQEET